MSVPTMTRRTFLKVGVAGAAVSVFGFDVKPAAAQARSLKIDRTTETRSVCPYCAVGCSVIIHTLGDKARNVTGSTVVHVEGDTDSPVKRGTLCSKGATLKDDIVNDRRITTLRYRAHGSERWEEKSWEWALVRGGNPAENHPVGFRFVMEAKRRRGAKLVAVDPRFQRTAAVADHFVQIRAGTDIAFLGGLINYALQNRRFQEDYVRLHTNAPFIVRDGFTFDEKTGLFSGWDPDKKQYDASTWQYELDGQGNAKVDPTLQHPRSVFQLMKKFYSRYTPQKVSEVCGCNAEAFTKAAEIITSTYTPTRVGTIMYALGWTHHSFSVQLIKTAAMLQLLLGTVGMPGGVMNALRGHANIQGGTDMGMAYHNVPGYMPIPKIGRA